MGVTLQMPDDVEADRLVQQVQRVGDGAQESEGRALQPLEPAEDEEIEHRGADQRHRQENRRTGDGDHRDAGGDHHVIDDARFALVQPVEQDAHAEERYVFEDQQLSQGVGRL
jgi:hypothetical protein